MVPKDSRDKAEYLLDRSYRSMQQWLLGQLVVMAFVGIATGIALWLMGIPFALALGFIAFFTGLCACFGPLVISHTDFIINFNCLTKNVVMGGIDDCCGAAA